MNLVLDLSIRVHFFVIEFDLFSVFSEKFVPVEIFEDLMCAENRKFCAWKEDLTRLQMWLERIDLGGFGMLKTEQNSKHPIPIWVNVVSKSMRPNIVSSYHHHHHIRLTSVTPKHTRYFRHPR